MGVAGGDVGLGQGGGVAAGEATAAEAAGAAMTAPDAPGDAVLPVARGAPVGTAVGGAMLAAGEAETIVPGAVGLWPKAGITMTAIANIAMNVAVSRSVGATRNERRLPRARALRDLNGLGRSRRDATDHSARSDGLPSTNP